MVLEEDLWANSSDGALCDGSSNHRTFDAGSDVITNLNNCSASSLMESIGGELYTEDSIGGASMETNLHYSLSQAPSTENNLNYFNTDHWDKEESDLSYYDWSGMESFVDVDKLFRNCDSTTGPGIVYDDDLGWFSSGQAVEGSNDALESNFRFQGSDAEILSGSVTDCPEVSGHNSSTLTNDNNSDLKPVPWRASSKKLIAHFPPSGAISSITNESEITTQIDGGKQVNRRGFRVKHRRSPEGNKYEDKSCGSIPQEESSYAKYKMQPVQSSNEFSSQNLIASGVEEKGLSHQLGAVDLDCANFTAQTACSGSFSYQKQVSNSEIGDELYRELNGFGTGIQAELDSVNALESCSIDPLFDEVSLEAISFRHLQHVMEQLDLKTKLCIRDSLYRLAKSAEQRNECGDSAHGSSDDQDANPSTSDETNKFTGVMDMETDTNPIDRSIAHLLFHRP